MNGVEFRRRFGRSPTREEKIGMIESSEEMDGFLSEINEGPRDLTESERQAVARRRAEIGRRG